MSMVPTPEYGALVAKVGFLSGRKLPGERELAVELGVSRKRVRAALARLEGEGRVVRRQGSGTYAVEEEAREGGTGGVKSVVVRVDGRLKLGGDPFFSHLVERIQGRLQAGGIRCVVERIGEGSPVRCEEDGMVLVGMAGEEMAGRLGEGGGGGHVPAVVIPASRGGGEVDAEGVSWFGLEDRRGGRDVARALRGMGAERLVYVGHNGLPVSEARLEGVRGEVGGSGGVEVIECGMNHSAGVEVAGRIEVGEGERVGVVAANDWLAVGLHAGLVARGVRERVVLASFDGLPETRTEELGISSMVVPLDQMADDCVGELRRLGGFGGRGGRGGRWIRYLMTWRKAGGEG